MTIGRKGKRTPEPTLHVLNMRKTIYRRWKHAKERIQIILCMRNMDYGTAGFAKSKPNRHDCRNFFEPHIYISLWNNNHTHCACAHTRSELLCTHLYVATSPWAVQPRAPNELPLVHQMPMFCFILTRCMHITNVDRFVDTAKAFWTLIPDASCLPLPICDTFPPRGHFRTLCSTKSNSTSGTQLLCTLIHMIS